MDLSDDGGIVDSDGKSQWELWSENCDRLPGMSSLRFFNFRSRGYSAGARTIEHNVRWIMCQANKGAVAQTMKTFLKRKIIKLGKGVDEADKKLAIFKTALIKDFDATLGTGEGLKWWEQHGQPAAQKLREAVVCSSS